MSAAWKAAERTVCRLAGGERSGPVGRLGPDCTDAAAWCIQVKRSGAGPALKASWLTQAARDAEADNFGPAGRAARGLAPRPWVLVQAVPRTGRATLYIATMQDTALLALTVMAHHRGALSLPAEWGVLLRRTPARPYLKAEEIAALTSGEKQPWLIHQRTPAWALATLDYRELVRLGRLAALIPAEPEEA